MNYAYYLIHADKHIRMAYHHGEIKNYEACLNNLSEAIVNIRLAVAALKVHVESDLTQRKISPQ